MKTIRHNAHSAAVLAAALTLSAAAPGQFSTEPWCRQTSVDRTWCGTMNRGEVIIDGESRSDVVFAYECDNQGWYHLYVGLNGTESIADVDTDVLTVRFDDAQSEEVPANALFIQTKSYSKKGIFLYEPNDGHRFLERLTSARSLAVEIPYTCIDPHWVRFDLGNARESITRTKELCRSEIAVEP